MRLPAEQPDAVGTEKRLAAWRHVLLQLVKDETLWDAALPDALARLLRTACSAVGADTVSVWRFARHGQQLVCLARHEAEAGAVSAQGMLLRDDHPAYFGALSDEPVLAVGDAMTDPRTADLVSGDLRPGDVQALLDATIRRKGRVAGVLCFERRRAPCAWSRAQIEMAAGLADLAGQLMLVAELRQRDQLQGLLVGLAPELGHNHSPKALADLAVRVLAQAFPNVWLGFYVLDPARDAMRLLAVHAPGASVAFLAWAQEFVLDDSLLFSSMRGLRVCRVDIDQVPYPAHRAIAQADGVRGYVGVPLVYGAELVGSMVLARLSDGRFGDDELAAVTLAAASLAVALVNARHVEALQHRAMHDSLTGLGNRDKLHQDTRAVADGGSAWHSAALLMMEAKDFKQVNDTLGRRNGDKLLQAVAQRVRAFADAKAGAAYRLNGAEFAVLLPNLPGTEAALQCALALQATLDDAFDVAGLALNLRPRVGTAFMPARAGDGRELLREADVALGWAADDAAGVCAFDPVRDSRAPRSLEMLAELRLAMGNGQLSLHLQPKVWSADGRLAGCEALLRWQHPRDGQVSPATFIGLAERGELMGPLTLWVLRRALQCAQALQAAGLNTNIAVNVSGHNMVDMQFPPQLSLLLQEAGMPPGCLTLEITETVLMSDPQRASSVIGALADLGLALDIDDFGTGHSSLAYLRRLPLKSLKIDRAFVRELTANAQDVHIVRSTVGLAHGLGLSVVAEGVEDDATLALLRSLGCDMVQGFGICRPLPLADFIAWARARAVAPVQPWPDAGR